MKRHISCVFSIPASFALGCAIFAPRDLRPEEPAELGDLLGFGATNVRYRVMEMFAIP